jgi:hypothetical protein
MTMIVSGLMLASINATVPLEPGPSEAHTVELARTRTRARTLTRTHVERLTSGPSPPAMGCFLRGHYLLLAPCRSFLTSHFLDGGGRLYDNLNEARGAHIVTCHIRGYIGGAGATPHTRADRSPAPRG